MKKSVAAAALLLAAAAAVPSTAGASIISPSVGRTVAATGRFTYREGFISIACTLSLGGTLTSPTTVSVTSGAVPSCSFGAMTIEGLPAAKTLLTASGQLTGEWSLPFIIRYVAPIAGTCRYQTTIAGAWTSDGVDTYLTFAVPSRLSTALLLSGSGALCSSSPAIAGSLTLSEVVTG